MRALLALLLGWFAAPAAASQLELHPSPDAVEAIGHALLEAVGRTDAVILLYAVVDEGMTATAIRYVPDGAAAVHDIAEQPDRLAAALADAWRAARAGMPSSAWREMIYVVDHGRVRVTLLYPEEVDVERTFHEKIEEQVERLFPGLPHVSDLPDQRG